MIGPDSLSNTILGTDRTNIDHTNRTDQMVMGTPIGGLKSP